VVIGIISGELQPGAIVEKKIAMFWLLSDCKDTAKPSITKIFLKIPNLM
jgi:hypothetical protein